jgi:hypothetical protein
LGRTGSSAPAVIPSFSNVVAVATGAEHSLAVKADGTVWAWGLNDSGQLGDGTTTNRSSPVQVVGLSGVTAIAAGQNFSLALETDGHGGGWVWAWGSNAAHQLGDGTTASRSVPVRIASLSSVVGIAAGRTWAMALARDGTVWTWGSNQYGQLGIGHTTAAATPTRVYPLTNVVSIGAGYWHAVVLDASGRLWGWGASLNGELGTANVYVNHIAWTPQLVPLSAPTVFSGGMDHLVVATTPRGRSRRPASGFGVSWAPAWIPRRWCWSARAR